MTKSILTNLQLEPQLIQGLEKVAAELHCRPNDLINEVVRSFIEEQKRIKKLKIEDAKRQSLLASEEDNPDAELWLKHNEESWLDEWK